MEFIEWPILATYAGALAMVVVITQITKEIKLIKKIPTQLWSYIVALLILYSAYYFTDQLNLSNTVLIFFNGFIVSLAANGGFEALGRAFPNIFKTK